MFSVVTSSSVCLSSSVSDTTSLVSFSVLSSVVFMTDCSSDCSVTNSDVPASASLFPPVFLSDRPDNPAARAIVPPISTITAAAVIILPLVFPMKPMKPFFLSSSSESYITSSDSVVSEESASVTATVSGISFCTATVSGISFCTATVSGISFCTATVSGISFCATTVSGISFCTATVSGISFCAATVSGISFCTATVPGITFCVATSTISFSLSGTSSQISGEGFILSALSFSLSSNTVWYLSAARTSIHLRIISQNSGSTPYSSALPISGKSSLSVTSSGILPVIT